MRNPLTFGFLKALLIDLLLVTATVWLVDVFIYSGIFTSVLVFIVLYAVMHSLLEGVGIG